MSNNRRNEERMKTVPHDIAMSAMSAMSQNQESKPAPFSFVVPTTFVDLPSRGRHYTEGHPFHNQNQVEIREMTAKDEDLLTSKALIKKGVVIDRFVQNILMDKSVNAETLLIGDKNAIIVAARIAAYGSVYEGSAVCPSCGETFDNSFELGDLEIYEGNDYEDYDISKTENNTFIIHIPKLDVDIETRLITGKEEKKLARMAKGKKKNNLPEAPLTDMLKLIIVSVAENRDSFLIDQLLDVLPASDSRYLRAAYAKVVPNIDMKREIVCPECDAVNEVEVQLSADFFWPKR